MLTAPPRDTVVPHASSVHFADAALLTWTVHLLTRDWKRLPRLVSAVMLVLAGGFLVFHNMLLAVIPSLALLLSLSEFLFPIRYTLTSRGAQVRHGLVTLEIAWDDVRRAYLTQDGIKLSPMMCRGSVLEPLRGIFLRFAGNEEAVISVVRRLRGTASDV